MPCPSTRAGLDKSPKTQSTSQGSPSSEEICRWDSTCYALHDVFDTRNSVEAFAYTVGWFGQKQ